MDVLTNSAQRIIRMRSDARSIFMAGVAAACPYEAVRRTLTDKQQDLRLSSGVVVIAIGKAACSMAQAARSVLRGKIKKAVAVTDAHNFKEVKGCRCVIADFPALNHNNVSSAIQDALCAVTDNVAIVLLMSSGGSTMVSAPPFGIDLATRRSVQDQLAVRSARADEIFTVRNALSVFGEDHLAQIVGSHKIISVHLATDCWEESQAFEIGFAGKTRSIAQTSLAILEKYQLNDQVAPAVLDHLRGPCAASERAAFGYVERLLLGTYKASLEGAADAAVCHGLVQARHVWMDDDIDVAAVELIGLAQEVRQIREPVAIVCGRAGSGRRNHEMALRFALLAEKKRLDRPWVFLSGSTHGDFRSHGQAGAVVDGGSCSWIRQLGIDPAKSVGNADAQSALAASGDLLVIGNTTPNVTNLELILLGER